MRRVRKLWIPIPVEGFDFPLREKFEVQGATVEAYPNIKNENIMEPMISVIVEGWSLKHSLWTFGHQMAKIKVRITLLLLFVCEI